MTRQSCACDAQHGCNVVVVVVVAVVVIVVIVVVVVVVVDFGRFGGLFVPSWGWAVLGREGGNLENRQKPLTNQWFWPLLEDREVRGA